MLGFKSTYRFRRYKKHHSLASLVKILTKKDALFILIDQNNANHFPTKKIGFIFVSLF